MRVKHLSGKISLGKGMFFNAGGTAGWIETSRPEIHVYFGAFFFIKGETMFSDERNKKALPGAQDRLQK